MSSQQIPDFPHRAALRELSEKIKEGAAIIQNALNPLVVHLQGGDATLGLGADWMDLAPIPARLRVLAQLPSMGAGAFIGEVEYEDGAEIDDVIVAESVRGLVLAGSFFMRIHDTEIAHRRYNVGEAFYLPHGLKHGWRVEGRTRSLLVFTPPLPAPAPAPDCDDDDGQPSCCSITPDLPPKP